MCHGLGENIYKSHTDKRSVPRIYKEFSKSKIRIKVNPIKSGSKI